MKFKKVALFILAVFVLGAEKSFAGSRLFYFEGQFVGGYSRHEKKAIYYSHDQKEVMQKPSVGFDYIQKFSGQRGDFGTLAVQGRVAWNKEGEDKIEPQIYNAYFKVKTRYSDFWIGHDRPALGLSSYFDSHGLLMPMLIMNGYGFDRDWGTGSYKDFEWGNVSASLTTGSGMALFLKGNWLLASRISKGVLNRDNYDCGFSLSHGNVLDVMGVHLTDHDPKQFTVAGVDFSILWNRFENRFEIMGGKKMGMSSYAVFDRITMNLLDENRLKFEVQPVYVRMDEEENHQLNGGFSFAATGDLTLRTLYQYDHLSDDHRGVAQIYYYLKI